MFDLTYIYSVQLDLMILNRDEFEVTHSIDPNQNQIIVELSFKHQLISIYNFITL